LNFVEIADWYKDIHVNVKDLSELKGQKVMVFSAIGNPSSFEQTLASCGLDILEAIRYPDHHDYGMLEMQYISERAKELKGRGPDYHRQRRGEDSYGIYLFQPGYSSCIS
jgi:3-deoxy-D-manno-octulosonic-acid transferase